MWKTASALTVIVLLLTALGIVMLASTSAVHGEHRFDDSSFYFKRQLFALLVGFVLALLASRFPYPYWKKLAVFMGAVSVILLVMSATPGVGIEVNGSRRWLRFGPINIQPSEFAKFSLIVLLAWWVSRNQRRMSAFWSGLMIPMGVIGLFAVLVLIEPDFGTTMLLGAVGVIMLFVAGTRIGYLVIAASLAFSGLVFLIMQNAERMRRIIAFLDPEKYAQNEAFQLLHALYAFVVGGPWGVGLGSSMQKKFYLPEAHTDFIFAITGEELGIIASLGVVVLFAAFFVCGFAIAFQSRDQFGRMLAFGITSMISLQAAINIGVVTACLPTKGLPLPFISFGGTSLVTTMMMIGVLLNVAIENAYTGDPNLAAIRDRSHGV